VERFGDVAVGREVLRGTLWWTKTEPHERPPLKPQNVYYRYPDPRVHVSHMDHVDDDEMVEVRQ